MTAHLLPTPTLDEPASRALADTRRIDRDPDVLEAFYRAHVVFVERFVVRRVTDAHAAADLTSEIFLSAISSCRSFDARRGDERAWLCGIARKQIAEHQRRSWRQQRAHEREFGRRPLQEDSYARLEMAIDAEARMRTLSVAMEALPARERAVLELVALDGLSVTQAAEALRISPGNARVRLHRARTRLQHFTAEPEQSRETEDRS